MKLLLGLLALSATLFANEFYSKLYPIHSFEVKSSVSGIVDKIDKSYEKKFVKNARIIKIDDYVDSIDLEQSKVKLANLEDILKIQEDTYNSYKRVSSKSKIETDTQKVQVLNTSTNISDLKVKIANLKNILKNKNITLENVYLEEISVEVGDYVTPGTPLFKAYDLSSGKLEIYLPISNAKSYLDKTIYLNGEKTDLKINKLSQVADSVHISAYKAEIHISNPTQFSKLIKIEFK